MVARALLHCMVALLLLTLWMPIGVFAHETSAAVPVACCEGTTGNISVSGTIDLTDLAMLIGYLTITPKPVLPCFEAADVNASGFIDLSDLSLLILYLTVTPTPVLPNCPSTGGMTFAERLVLFNAIDSVEALLSGVTSDSLAIALDAFLGMRGELEAHGRDSLTVWGRFTDGRVLVIPNNRPPTNSPGAEMSGQFVQPDTAPPPEFVLPHRRFESYNEADILANPRKASATQFELPTQLQARVIATLGTPCFTVGTAKAEALLTSKGYTLAPSSGAPKGSVPDLLVASGDGVFYIDAHCGTGYKRGGGAATAVWTASMASVANDAAYSTMLDNAELVYMKMPDRLSPTTCGEQWRLAFTGEFVAQYMSFGNSSFILINACESDRPSLRAGFAAAGASVFAGWSRVVSDGPANKAGEFLLDRMLGTNASTLTPVENPPQRPFDVTQLWLDMKKRGIDTDGGTGAKLIVTRLQGDFELLAPSIRFMAILEDVDTLYVTGYFGTNPNGTGKLIIGGTEMPIALWEPQLITAVIPNSGAGSVGPVTVDIDGRVSNTVNITEWNFVLTYKEFEAGSMVAEMKLHSHLRADAHLFRESPGIAPIGYTLQLAVAEDSYGEASATGTYTYIDPSDPTNHTTYDWAGSCFLPGLWEHNPASFWYSGPFNTVDKTWRPMLIAQSPFELNLLIDGELASQFGINIYNDLYDDQLFRRIHFTFDSNWNLNSYFKQRDEPCCSFDQDNPEITHLLSMPATTASWAPDPQGAR